MCILLSGRREAETAGNRHGREPQDSLRDRRHGTDVVRGGRSAGTKKEGNPIPEQNAQRLVVSSPT